MSDVTNIRKMKSVKAGKRRIDVVLLLFLGLLLVSGTVLAQDPTSNVNLIGMTPDPDDIPDVGYRQQNEPACTVRTDDSACIFCAYNDYRGVDFPIGAPIGDSWLGVSQSCDAGATWRSRIMPGHPGDLDAELIPAAFAADPRAAAIPGVGNPGMVILNFIAGFRDTNVGVLGIQHWLEVNKEDADHNEPSRITWFADSGTSGRFIDKPDILPVLAPTNQQGTIELVTEMENTTLGPDGDGVITRNFPTGTLYVAYAVLTGSQSFKVLVKTSADWGRTFKNQVLKLSEDQNQVSGVSLTAVDNKVIAVWRRLGDNNDLDSIMFSVITNKGKKATKAEVLADICAFDQPTLAGETFDLGGPVPDGPFVAFRTNDFPWIANDGDNVFAFFSERKRNPDGSCDVFGRPRIVMKYSTDAGQTWQGQPVTDLPITLNEPSDPPAPGSFQFMPTAFGANGKIQVAWYDTRREIFGGAGTIWPFVTDYDVANSLFVQRAVDVYTTSVTLTSGGLDIPPPIRLSQYSAQLAEDEFGNLFSFDTEANLGNKKLFGQGQASFLGDYLAMAARLFRPTSGGKWESNASLRPTELGGEDFFAAWADNRDVVGEVLSLTDPSSYGFPAPATGVNNLEGDEESAEMLADSQRAPVTGPPRDTTMTAEGLEGDDTIAPCTAETERTRDSNIYGTLIRRDERLFASTPSKPLSLLKRAFPVSLTNSSGEDLEYVLSIDPPGAASFRQQTQQDREPPSPPDTFTVRARSTESRTVFVDPLTVTSFKVIAEQGGNIVSTIELGDTATFSDPENCVNGVAPDGVTPCDVDENELHDLALQELTPEAAALLNAALLNAALLNVGVQAGDLAEGAVNAALLNAALLNADLLNANLLNPTLVALAQEGGLTDPTCGSTEPDYPSLCPGYVGDPIPADIINFAVDDEGETINAALLNAALLNAALLNANLLNANLLNANLLNANLLNANLLNANLLNANLLNANLLNATVLNANLLNADLLNANLLNANLLNANLLNATILEDPTATITYDDYTYPVTNNGNVTTAINSDIQINAPAALDADGIPIDVDADGNPIKDVLGTKLIAWTANATPTRVDCEDRVQLDSRVQSIAPNPDNDLEVAEIETPFKGEVTAVAAPGETVFFTLRVVGTPAQLRNVRVSGFTASSQASNCQVDASALGYTCADNLRDDNERILFQDTIPPVMTLNGVNPTRVELGVEIYEEPGATVIDNIDGDISSSVEIGGDIVLSDTVGTYFVEYNVSDSAGNAADTQTRTVIVEDTIAPVITLTPNGDGDVDFTLEAGVDSYSDPGFNLVEAGNPSATVVVGGDTVDPNTVDIYVVTYTADDGVNPPTVETRTVTVEDTIAPVITLNPNADGEVNFTLEAGVDVYTDPGFGLVEAGNPSTTVVIGGDTVDANTVGTYFVTYTADDGVNPVTVVTRVITVVDTTLPAIDPVTPPTGFDPDFPFPFELEAADQSTLTLTWPVNVNDADPLLDIRCYVNWDDATQSGDEILRISEPQSIITEEGNERISASFMNSFPVGDTAIVCTAVDTNGTVTIPFTVTVEDNFAPVVVVSIDTLDIESEISPIVVNYSDMVTITVEEFGWPGTEATCDPASGAEFSWGDTTVTCTATDGSGNTGTDTFIVSIRLPYDIDLVPPKKSARAGSTVPLDWRYIDWDSGLAIDSSAFPVGVIWQRTVNGGDNTCMSFPVTPASTDGSSFIFDADSGNSDFRYSESSNSWQLSWQTPNATGWHKVAISPPGVDVEDAWACIRLR